MNQILKTIAIIILVFSTQYNSQAQTLVPFYDIAVTPVLPNSAIINAGEAHMRINNLLGGIATEHEKKYMHYKGQYYFKDNLVINIQANTYSPKSSRYKLLYDMKKGLDAFYLREATPGTYFSDIKQVTNYHVFISYRLNANTSKDAVIIDDQGRYMIFIYVYGAKDSVSMQKAIDMVNQVANSITFFTE